VVAPSYTGSCSGASSTQLIKDYAYDYLNRMAAYQSYAAGAVQDQATYDYDPLDRVLQETEKQGSSPTRTTDFAYLGLTNLVTNESQSGDAHQGRLKGTETSDQQCDQRVRRIGPPFRRRPVLCSSLSSTSCCVGSSRSRAALRRIGTTTSRSWSFVISSPCSGAVSAGRAFAAVIG
jgi:hypothetical protein